MAALLHARPGIPISAIREEYEHASTGFGLAEAARRRGHGLPHPGHDLWAFPRTWIPSLALGDVTLGVSLVATALNQALFGRSGCHLTLLSRKLTFHVVEGESVVRHKWLQREMLTSLPMYSLALDRHDPTLCARSLWAGARNDPLFFKT